MRPRRRRIIWVLGVLTLLFAAGAGVLAWLLRPARLRPLAQAALRERFGDDVRVAGVSYAPLATIHVTGLDLQPRHPGAAALEIAEADIDCDFAALLRGALVPRHIGLRGVRATWRPGAVGDNVGDWFATSGPASALASGAADFTSEWGQTQTWPTIQIEDAELIVVEGQGSPEHEMVIERARLAADGRPTARGYALAVRHGAGGAALSLEYDSAARTLDLSSDWLRMDTLARLLPEKLREALAAARVAGRVRAVRVAARLPESGTPVDLRLDSLLTMTSAAEIDVDQASAVFSTGDPLPPADMPLRDDGADLVRVRDGYLALRYTGGDAGGVIAVSGTGRLNDAPLTFQSTLSAAALLAREPVLEDVVIDAEARVEGLAVPSPATHPKLITGPRLPGPIRALFREYEPTGHANAALRLAAPRAGESLSERLSGEFEPLDATCRYEDFPYPFSDIRGRILLVGERLLFDGLTGRHGPATVRVTGALNSTRQWTGFDLTFDASDVPLDPDLYAALPARHQSLWDAAAPTGVCQVVTRVRRDDPLDGSGPSPTEIEVTAQLGDGAVSLGDAGRLTKAGGRIVIRGGAVLLQGLTGWLGDARVTLSGTISTGDPTPVYDLQLAAEDYAIEDSSDALADDNPRTPRDALRISARCDVTGRVFASPDGTRNQRLVATLRRGTLQAFGDSAVWTDLRGSIVETDTLRRVESLTARQGDSEFTASAVLPKQSDPNTPLHVELRLSGPRLETILPQFVPSAWRRLCDDIGLRSSGAVRIEIDRPMQAPPTATLEVSQAAMLSPRLPIPLTDVHGDVHMTPTRFDVGRVEARWGELGVLTGRGTCAWDGDIVQFDGELRGRELAFTPELVAALPDALRQPLTRLGARGGFDIELNTLSVSGRAPFTWRFDGRMPLRDVELKLGIPFENVDGELRGGGELGASGDAWVDATLSIDRGRAAGVAIEGWRGHVVRTDANTPVVIENLVGRVADGEARGAVSIDPARGGYELELTFRDVKLSAFDPPAPNTPDDVARGRMDGQITLRGVGDDVSTRTGGGQVRLRLASFLQTPLLSSVFRESRLGGRANDDIDLAELTLRWEGAAVRLTHVDLVSRDIRLVGEGVWYPADNRVDITLVGAHPKDWPRLAMVTDLIESAGGEILQFHVTGTLKKPQVTAKPLRRLDEALRTIIRGTR